MFLLLCVVPLFARALHVVDPHLNVDGNPSLNLTSLVISSAQLAKVALRDTVRLYLDYNLSTRWPEYDGLSDYYTWAREANLKAKTLNTPGPALHFTFYHRLFLARAGLNEGLTFRVAIPVEENGNWDTDKTSFCGGVMLNIEALGWTSWEAEHSWVTAWRGSMPSAQKAVFEVPFRAGLDANLGDATRVLKYDLPKIRAYLKSELGRQNKETEGYPNLEMWQGSWKNTGIYAARGRFSPQSIPYYHQYLWQLAYPPAKPPVSPEEVGKADLSLANLRSEIRARELAMVGCDGLEEIFARRAEAEVDAFIEEFDRKNAERAEKQLGATVDEWLDNQVVDEWLDNLDDPDDDDDYDTDVKNLRRSNLKMGSLKRGGVSIKRDRGEAKLARKTSWTGMSGPISPEKKAELRMQKYVVEAPEYEYFNRPACILDQIADFPQRETEVEQELAEFLSDEEITAETRAYVVDKIKEREEVDMADKTIAQLRATLEMLKLDGKQGRRIARRDVGAARVRAVYYLKQFRDNSEANFNVWSSKNLGNPKPTSVKFYMSPTLRWSPHFYWCSPLA